MPSQARIESLTILIPVYNDWDSVEQLIPLIDRVVADPSRSTRLILVDDGSTDPLPQTLRSTRYDGISRLDVLRLRRNLGSQRAIAVGLTYVRDHCPCDAMLIMDGDGEDSPGDIPRLIQKCEETQAQRIVFAERMRRSESKFFIFYYHLYRLIHRLITGLSVRVGNYSLVPWKMLSAMVVVPDLWNHYAASVYKARLPTAYVHTERATRLSGTTRLNFVGHVIHGLSAVSVHSELTGVRLLIAFGLLCALSFAGFLVILTVHLVSGSGLSGSTALFGVLFLLVLLQMGLYALMACFITLGLRTSSQFLPHRDYAYFVEELLTLYTGDEDK